MLRRAILFLGRSERENGQDALSRDICINALVQNKSWFQSSCLNAISTFVKYIAKQDTIACRLYHVARRGHDYLGSISFIYTTAISASQSQRAFGSSNCEDILATSSPRISRSLFISRYTTCRNSCLLPISRIIRSQNIYARIIPHRERLTTTTQRLYDSHRGLPGADVPALLLRRRPWDRLKPSLVHVALDL